MKSQISKGFGWLSAMAALFCLGFQTPASAQQGCDLSFSPNPAPLSSYITAYPGYKKALGAQQQLVSWYAVEVTNIVNHTNYLNPPVPYGVYPAWCIDEWTYIDPASVTIPGTYYTGSLFSTCDPNLNSELPPGHPNTLVTSNVWQMVNYILNYHTYNGTNAFYWDVQAAINTLVGSAVGSVNPCGGIYTTPTPEGGCEAYPVYDPVVVQALLEAATNNAAEWVPQCGQVIGAIYTTGVGSTNQFLIIPVPVPCSPCIGVTKAVACMGPTNSCGDFGTSASGYVGVGCSGVNEPAFCYQISITNCGTIPLTNVVVSDNLLGNLTANFITSPSQVFWPGSNITAVFSMSFAANATNTVTVTGAADLSQTVTNAGAVYTNGSIVSANSSAVALIDTASIICGLNVSSPNALSNSTPNNLVLPSATYYSTSNAVTLTISVTNSGAAALNGIAINVPSLAAFGCGSPALFDLAAGASTNIQLCFGLVTCPAQINMDVTVTATVSPDTNHCGVYTLGGSLVSVCSSCLATVACSTGSGCLAGTANIGGVVVLDCSPNSDIAGDSGIPGVPVILYGASSNALATNITDINGDYSFTGLASGIYTVQVEAPTNYVEDYPPGNTNSEVTISITPCIDQTNIDFGFANTTPPVIAVPPGGSLGCNPVNLPDDSSIATNITVSSSCGSVSTNISHVDTNTTCSYSRIFTIVATDSYGNSATNYITNTWTTANLAFVNVPAGADLGCNPLTLPQDTDISNAVTYLDTCSTATNSVTHADTNSGCSYTRIFTIVAGDTCGDTAMTSVTDTWTVATLKLNTVPAGTNLGCNPVSLRSDTDISNAVTYNDTCSTVSSSVTHVDSNSGCNWTRVFTISATDTCNDSVSTTVTDSWTTATLTFANVPASANLGCNPATILGDSDISNAVSYSDTCSTVSGSVTHVDSNSGCNWTRVFTISATDTCGDSVSTTVTDAWSTASLALNSVPDGASLGCNPTNIPTVATITAGVQVTDNCSTPAINVTCATTTNSCAITQIFTIVASDSCNDSATAYVTNTWTTDSAKPLLSGVPAGTNYGCNPASVLTVAALQATVKATDTCSQTTVNVSAVTSTNGCAMTEVFTIIATNACGNSATACVTNTWTADTAKPLLSGLPVGTNFGCNPASVPTVASVQASVKASDTCSPATINVSGVTTTNGCGVTQVFTIIATNACGNSAIACVTNTWTYLPPTIITSISYMTNVTVLTNYAYVTNTLVSTNVSYSTNIVITTNACTNSICGTFNWGNPGSGWLWLNCHLAANPGSNCTISCTGGSVTLGCISGKSYSYPIPDGTVTFSSSCTTATNWFDGTSWHTTLPCAGDDQVFVQGCPIPWQSDFASCQSVCWTTTFSSTTPGLNCNWQWGAACYSGSAPACGQITPKACHSTPCQSGQYYYSGDYAGCPESQKPNCVSGGTGYGYPNCTGSWTPNCTTCKFGVTTNKTVTPMTTYTTNTTVVTNKTTTPITTITTNSIVTSSIAGPVLGGVPVGTNFGCNPAIVPTPAGVQALITASQTCSQASINVTGANVTNGCVVTQTLIITAANACGGLTTAYVTNIWTVDKVAPVITGLPTSTFMGCTSGTNLPGDANILAVVKATDSCSTPYITVSHIDTTNGCTGTRSFTITAADACGNVATTNLVYSWTGHTPDYCTNSLCAQFNSKNPGSGWLWLNANCSGNPGRDCTLYCQGATVTLNCTDGKSYTYPVPNGTVHFSSSCTVATNWFDGTNWNTTLPCAGDDQIFLQGCAIPWQWDFANCKSVCWNGTFSCDTVGQSFNWQWGASCFANGQPAYANICPKACHQTTCPNGQYYGASDFAGCPENHKPYCVAGGTGLGGTNCTGSWSGVDTTCTFTAGTSIPPVLNGVPANDDLGLNPTNIPTIASVLAAVTATDTCSPAPVSVTMCLFTNSCAITQIFNIGATNDCGQYAVAGVTNTWTTLMCTNHYTNTICSSFTSQNPGSGWVWLNCQVSGKPGTNEILFNCTNASVTLSCTDGKTYTFPVPNGTIHFSPNCTTATNCFDGTNNWCTTLPCAGDDQIFLSGCAIPWQSDFAGCRSVCWTGDFSCSQPGCSFNWQFGAACYSDTQPTPSQYGGICAKACHQTTCPNGYYFHQADCAGTPESHNPYCVGGGTGYGGSSWTGGLSNPGSCKF